MRKKKLLFMIVLSVIVTTFFVPFSVTAYDIPIASYEKYQLCLDNLGEHLPYEEEFTDKIGVTNIYISSPDYLLPTTSAESGMMFNVQTFVKTETITSEGVADFRSGWYTWTEPQKPLNYNGTITEFIDENFDKLNAFLSENGLKAKFVKYDYEESDTYKLGYSVDATLDEIIFTYLRLNKEFGVRVPLESDHELSMVKYYCEPNAETTTITVTETEPVIEFGEASHQGDVDCNDSVEIADLTGLTKYLMNSELFPLGGAVANANADINGDLMLNSADGTLLAEMILK